MQYLIGGIILAVGLVAVIAGITSHGPQLYQTVTGHTPPIPNPGPSSLGDLLFPGGLGINILGGLGAIQPLNPFHVVPGLQTA